MEYKGLKIDIEQIVFTATLVTGYILKQIDLLRIKRGKKPLFSKFDIIDLDN